MMIHMYTRKSLGSLCVFSNIRRRRQACRCLPPDSIKNPIYPNSNRKSTFPNRIKKVLENYIHQITSFFKSTAQETLLNLPFLPTSNSSRIFKYTSSTKSLFSAAAASSSRIPRIPGPAQGNVKKDFARWMWRARYRKKKKKGEEVSVGGFFGGGGGETDLRSGEFDRFGRDLDGDEEFLL